MTYQRLRRGPQRWLELYHRQLVYQVLTNLCQYHVYLRVFLLTHALLPVPVGGPVLLLRIIYSSSISMGEPLGLSVLLPIDYQVLPNIYFCSYIMISMAP